MRRIYMLVVGLLIGFIISGFFFSSVSRSGEQGDQFYLYLKNGDYDRILNLIDQDALKVHPKVEWLQIFNSRANDWGNLVSYTNTGFHTETINGKSITKLDYTVITSNGIIYEHIDFVKRGSVYKILAYEFSPEREKIIVNK